MTIKHILITRFFPFQVNGYTRDIKSPEFLRSQAKIFKNNLLSSIENQSNKDMTLVIIVNDESYRNPEIAKIINGLKEASPIETIILPLRDMDGTLNSFSKDSKFKAYLNGYLNDFDYLIESRTDFDDFFHSNASQRVKDIIRQNQPNGIILHGYCRGITYISNNDIYEFDYFKDGKKRSGHWAIFTSMIINCSDLKGKPFMSIFGVNHGDPRLRLENYGMDTNINTNIIQDDMVDAFVYFKHDACWSSGGTGNIKLPDYARVRKFTEEECEEYIKNIFPNRFGFNTKNT